MPLRHLLGSILSLKKEEPPLGLPRSTNGFWPKRAIFAPGGAGEEDWLILFSPGMWENTFGKIFFFFFPSPPGQEIRDRIGQTATPWRFFIPPGGDSGKIYIKKNRKRHCLKSQFQEQEQKRVPRKLNDSLVYVVAILSSSHFLCNSATTTTSAMREEEGNHCGLFSLPLSSFPCASCWCFLVSLLPLWCLLAERKKRKKIFFTVKPLYGG